MRYILNESKFDGMTKSICNPFIVFINLLWGVSHDFSYLCVKIKRIFRRMLRVGVWKEKRLENSRHSIFL